ncbi:MAG: glycerophosphodiester phosphodiesterase [Deltaproteobacteria bacterium]|nr:glycerophosphodiester phosphodiesterase [Deltaproteobacteria bacterium]
MNTTSGQPSAFASRTSGDIDAKTRIYGHRGASACEPENSLPAFARARSDGADGVELDVRLCASGELFVFHDKDLRRLAGRPERFDALDYGQVRSLTLSSGVGVPSLPEVFEAVGPDMFVNVELKTDALASRALPRLVAAVAKTLGGVPRPERVILSSFNPLAVLASAVAMPRIARGLLFESDGPLWARGQALIPVMPLQAVHPQNHLCTAAAVAMWKARGLAINVWTVDDPQRQRELVALGVDGIITNNPAAARANLSGL